MALLALAGIDYHRIIRSDDPVEVQAAQAVAERVLKLRAEIEGRRLDHLARNIGVHTGNAVAKALGPVLQQIGRALH